MNEICLYCKHRGRDGVCLYFGKTFDGWRLGIELQREVEREYNGNCWRFELKPSLTGKRFTMEELRRLPLGVLAKLQKRRK